MKQIEKEINAFYGKYAKDNEISWSEAKKLLNSQELKSFKDSLNDYIKALKKAGYPKDQILELQNLYTKSRISRLEELKANINYELMKLTKESNDKMEKYFSDTFEEQYYKTIFDVDKNIGFATSFTKPNKTLIEKALAKNYNLANFSVNGDNAVWKRKDYLMTILNQKIPQGLTLGYNPRKLAELVSKQLETDYNSTVRLIRTEYNALQNEATAEGYKACGIEQYQILATLDDRTSEICQDMDGVIEDLSKREVGVNYPPFHPNCRTTTIPYFEPDEIDEEFGIGTRLAKDKDGNYYEVPANMTYKQWREGLENNSNGEVANKEVKIDKENKTYKEVLKNVEDRIRNNETETAIVLDSKGNILLDKSEGNKNSVNFTKEEALKLKNATITHNHPNGTAFSKADLDLAYNNGVKEIRAVYKDGYYSLLRNFNIGDEIPEDYKNFVTDFKLSMDVYKTDVTDKLFKETKDAKKCNKLLADFRQNWIKGNAEKYGWIYKEGKNE